MRALPVPPAPEHSILLLLPPTMPGELLLGGCVWPLAFPAGTSQLLTQLWFSFSQTGCLEGEGLWGFILQVLLPERLTLAWELVLWLGQVHNLSAERLLGFLHTILPRQHPKVLCTTQRLQTGAHLHAGNTTMGCPKWAQDTLGPCQLKEKPFSCWHPKCNEVSTLENQGLCLQGLLFPIQHLSHPRVTWGCCSLLTVGETEAGSG